jgi:hypothetical protein
MQVGYPCANLRRFYQRFRERLATIRLDHFFWTYRGPLWWPLWWLYTALFASLIVFFVLWLLERSHKWASEWLPNFVAEWSGILLTVVIVESVMKTKEEEDAWAKEDLDETEMFERLNLAGPLRDAGTTIANAIDPLLDFITATHFYAHPRVWDGNPINVVRLTREWEAEERKEQTVNNLIWVRRLKAALDESVSALARAAVTHRPVLDRARFGESFSEPWDRESWDLYEASTGLWGVADDCERWLRHEDGAHVRLSEISRNIDRIASIYFRLTDSILLKEAPTELDDELAHVYELDKPTLDADASRRHTGSEAQ